ncbi:MAG TPA: beta-N-acetylhexosaminidase [Gammaproteobacteria bacterium]|nr:beta-N-acetylhexosaminidase [Gammaproteobacteria bacterium]
MLDVGSLHLGEEDRERLQHPMVGGVILFSRNFRDADQLAELITEIRQLNTDVVIAVDQEGGRVQRFRHGFERLPPLASLGRWYDEDSQAALEGARVLGFLMAVELVTKDIDLSFAPVLDLHLGISGVIGDRAFHAEPMVVTQLASAYIEGMNAAGMRATAKHFPGHGSVVEDSHFELPRDERTFEQICQQDLLPFQTLIKKMSALMTAHLVVPEVDNSLITFSEKWLKDILRGELGFQGVIFSDDLSMNAAQSLGSAAKRAEAAWSAGCNVLLVCNDSGAADEILLWAENHITEQDLPQFNLYQMRAQRIDLTKMQSLYTKVDQVLAITNEYAKQ